MSEQSERDWFGILEKEFDHPSIVLWRSIELKQIEKFKDRLTQPVLDLGCAEGKIAAALFSGTKAFGIDNCWELLKGNRQEGVYRGVVLGDGCHMPYKDASFGSVFSNCVVEHIPDLEALLPEVNRVLKDEGVFLFTVPSHLFGEYLFFSHLFNRIGLRAAQRWYAAKRNALLNHFHCYDHTGWESILKEKGFRLTAYSYYMGRRVTCWWDFAAAVNCAGRIWPLCCFLPKINKILINRLKKYYNMDSKTGSALLLVARKIR